MRDAWRSVGDSLLDEASRIRQSISGNTPESLSQAEARFAIASAQARAGDVEAAKLLPGLAQAMLTIGEQQSVSLSDLQSLRNRTAGSLEMVANMIGATYGVSAAKAITGLAPAAVSNYAPAPLQASSFQAQQATQSDMVSELELLRKELIDLRKQIDVSNANTERAARALEGDQSSPILVEIAP